MAQVQGEEIYLSHSGQEVDDNIDEVVAARGSEASLSARLTDIVSDFEADQQRQETEIGAVAAMGAKNNLLITNSNGTLVVNGITFTKNADQTITATGTATANADYPLNSAQTLIIGQQYILSGCPSGGGADNFFLRQLSGAIDYGDGATFTAESSSANFFIRIRNGYTIQGSLTFKPMLRPAKITDDTFVPYAPTNRELYETKITLADVFGLGKVLASGDSMDSLPLGRFTCANGTIAANVSSAPWANAGFFGWTMESVRAGDRFVQLAIKNNDDFEIAKRRYAGTWSAWVYGITTPASASTQSAPASLMQAGRIDAELTDAGRIDTEQAAAEPAAAETGEEADA